MRAVIGTPDPFETNPDHEDDDVRQRDWDDFVQELVDFANVYGWPDTLRALAQALQADQATPPEAA